MASDGSPVRDAREKKKKRKAGESRTDETDAQVEIQRLTEDGHAALQTGDKAAALQCFKNALKAATKLRESRLQRTCAFNLGAAYVEAGRPQKGLDLLSRSQSGERGERIADLQHNLATAHEALGDHTRAVRHYLQAAQLYRSQGDAYAEGDTCVRLARCHLKRQEGNEAADAFKRAAESYKLVGSTSAAALALKDAGKHMLKSGRCEPDDIITVLTDSLEMSTSITDQETLGMLLNDVGLSFTQLRLFSEAAECYEQALPLVTSKPHRLAVVLQNLGAVHNTLGQFEEALRYHREAAALHGSLGSRGAQGRCFSNLGFALVELGELEEAWESFLHAQQAFRDADDPSGQWQVCEGLGGIKLQMRDPEKATNYYKDALRLLCQCQEVSSSIQERLVSKLSEGLQQKLLLQQTRPSIQRERRQPRVTAVRSDMKQDRRETLEKRTHGGNSHKASEDRKPTNEVMMSSDSHLNEEHTAETHDLTALPEANRNLNNMYEKPAIQQHIVSVQSSAHIESSSEAVMLKSEQTNGGQPSIRSEVTPPSNQPDSDEATPLTRRLTSRFCTVM
ncbi:tetratricopeptide repeat protein 24 [Triplophysa dalaica]|uniref:tetratricopeptide repeat protein 24 n=1 Tax=Triplophysa dalaica TaxID=1582913 RepID=UPI0024E02131|nr:tetratricopeptide repeat protein 24 [Triplophysa dalaica]XP_056619281.1 tetratricopeptide repeat protein 24 [Triplophysa dalaica]